MTGEERLKEVMGAPTGREQQETNGWREKMNGRAKKLGRDPRKEVAKMEGDNVRERNRRMWEERIEEKQRKEVNSLLFSELQGGYTLPCNAS